MSDDTCPATNNRGEPCGLAAGWGTDNESGPCKFHGGAADGGAREGAGAPEGNGNAETHGLTADARKWFERHRDEVEDDVRLLVQSWITRAPFGWDHHGNVWLLVECAIDEVRMQQADAYVDEDGLIVESYEGHDKVSGQEIRERRENPALLPKSRMKKDTVRTLKDLGILDDPDSQQATATQDAADALRSFMEAADR